MAADKLKIFPSASLIREWADMTTVGHILETGMLIVQLLTIVLDIIELGSAVGLYAVSGVFAVALPIFGAVLTVIGVVLMILSLFLNKEEKKTPPDPVKEFIMNEVRTLVRDWADASANQLTYEIQPGSLPGGAPAALRVKVSNNSGANVALRSSTVVLTSGDNDTCTLKEKAVTLSKADDSKKDTAGRVYLDQSATVTGSLNSNRMGNAAEFYKFTLDIFGPEKKEMAGLGELIVKKVESFTAIGSGTAAKAGKGVVEVVERWAKDSSHKQTWVTRT